MSEPLALTRWGRVKYAASVAPFELPIVIYLAMTGARAVVTGARSTPATLDDSLPDWMVMTWALCLSIGGLITVYGLIRQATHMEAGGLIIIAWPCALYAATLTLVAGGSGVAAAAAYFAILTGCGFRLRVLFLADRARRIANLLLRETNHDA